MLLPCPTLCDPMDCRPPGSSLHWISQARKLEWVAMPFSRASSWPRDWTAFLFFFFPLSNFLFFKIYFNWRLITILWWFLPYIDINQPWVDMCSPSWPSLLPPSHPIPQGHPSAPALSTLSHASNLDWWSFSHMVIYMFQCYSLKSSHLHLLPQSPKDCSLHLGLFWCLAYRVIITIFLNSIYMR